MSKERKEYLRGLAEDYGLPLSHVVTVAILLGEDEDYDGLISTLEDMSWEVE